MVCDYRTKDYRQLNRLSHLRNMSICEVPGTGYNSLPFYQYILVAYLVGQVNTATTYG
jgi:hypothetical protein